MGIAATWKARYAGYKKGCAYAQELLADCADSASVQRTIRALEVRIPGSSIENRWKYGTAIRILESARVSETTGFNFWLNYRMKEMNGQRASDKQ